MKKFFFLSIVCLFAWSMNAQEYVDLGLPSGTKWKDQNETELYTFTAAHAEFGNSLPTYQQFEELKEHCMWIWTDNGYKVLGSNGNFILLPKTNNFRHCNGDWEESLENSMPIGRYWSSTAVGTGQAWLLLFNWNGSGMTYAEKCFWYNVRLVQNP